MNSATLGVHSMILIKFKDIYPTHFDVIIKPLKTDIYKISTPYEGVFTHKLESIS
jgi:hypothetical protein